MKFVMYRITISKKTKAFIMGQENPVIRRGLVAISGTTDPRRN